MEIKVKLHLSEKDRGVALWVIAQDGTRRQWFKWYKDKVTAQEDAENMRLAERQVSPSSSPYLSNISRTLLTETNIDDDVLKSSPKSSVESVSSG